MSAASVSPRCPLVREQFQMPAGQAPLGIDHLVVKQKSPEARWFLGHESRAKDAAAFVSIHGIAVATEPCTRSYRRLGARSQIGLHSNCLLTLRTNSRPVSHPVRFVEGVSTYATHFDGHGIDPLKAFERRRAGPAQRRPANSMLVGRRSQRRLMQTCGCRLAQTLLAPARRFAASLSHPTNERNE